MAAPAKSAQDKETLIVASKLKNYIKARSGMNTSADVLEVLSDFVRHQANDAIDRAREEGRRTVKARDFLV
jgi:histone H3/H4